MYAKSFLTLDGNVHLTGANTAQIYPYDHYTCHLCSSPLVFHPEWSTNSPWFEHTWDELTDNGRQHCPYVHPEAKEVQRVRMLRRYVPDVLPIVRKADWLCSGCDSHYHGERYCMDCSTGEYSTEIYHQ